MVGFFKLGIFDELISKDKCYALSRDSTIAVLPIICQGRILVLHHVGVVRNHRSKIRQSTHNFNCWCTFRQILKVESTVILYTRYPRPSASREQRYLAYKQLFSSLGENI